MGSSINLADIALPLAPEEANFHRQTVADLLHRQHVKFPGAQPVSFARKHLVELQNDDYFLCEKTDGIRCLLFLTETYGPEGPEEAQFLIDRKNDYYYITGQLLHMPIPADPLDASQGFHKTQYHVRTLLDGELVRQRWPGGREQLTYLIFDCLAIQGESITNRTYSVRVGKLQLQVLQPWKAFAKAWPQDASRQPFQLKMKDWQLPYATEMMFKEVIPHLPHGNDGLIYTNKNTPYVSGTDTHILKWKPPHENTVDFRLQVGAFPMDEDEDGRYEDYDQEPELELLVFHGNKDYRKFADLHLTDVEWEAIKGMNQQLDGRIIECFRDSTNGHWRPKIETDGTPRFRDDKENANHISVVDSVIESIEDAVTEQDLIDVAQKVRTAYKERERLQKEQASLAKRRDDLARLQLQQARTSDRPAAQQPPPVDSEAPGYED